MGSDMISQEWKDKIESAQSDKNYVVDGVFHRRIPYGEEGEDWCSATYPCHDCGVVKGQLHVVSCDVELCPICGGQAFCCGCFDDAELAE